MCVRPQSERRCKKTQEKILRASAPDMSHTVPQARESLSTQSGVSGVHAIASVPGLVGCLTGSEGDSHTATEIAGAERVEAAVGRRAS